ncbi:MAG TPA: methionine--tRNA ligase [Blastocatellia bacterium]|jgi:methionyl-tRNA synthetase|nr:methionine--tRNA ligase [Blastocatellia bacterium]
MTETFYITTPIYYVNAKPHIGHAYTTMVADSIIRFKRQRGIDSFFLTGTDEHGINVERAAAARGVPVKEHVDQIVQEFKTAFAPLGIEYDRWIRTTDPAHEKAVQELWRRLDERGYIYKGHYSGWFCGNCNEFKDVEPDAENPACPVHERPLDRVEEESYFFKLSEFQGKLLELYDSQPDFVRPESRRNEVRSFVAGGLKDLSISRVSVKWGIPVPGDPKHTIYVWLDALSNYITALGWGNDEYGGFDKYWPGLHLVGKDILRFHTVYWPAFLYAAGIELPRGVFVHGMLLMGGRKMSKTLGNVVRAGELLSHFTPDMIRYFILREVVFGLDGYFSYEAIIDRVNSDLADGLGNLASRTLTMVRNYFGGVPPRPVDDKYEDMIDVRNRIEEAKAKFDEEFSAFSFSRALEAAWAGIARVDKFITDNQPWKLAKDPAARAQLEGVLATAYEGLRHLVLLVAPALPESTREIWSQMGLAGEPLGINPRWARWGEPIEASRIDRVSPVFPKLNKEKIMAEIENNNVESGDATARAGAAQVEQASEQAALPDLVKHATTKTEEVASPVGATQAVAPPESEKITIDDFVKVELRAATVLEAERVPKADKLLRLQVDLGEEKPRQILAGIAEHYAPEDVIGRKIIVVSNLAPRKLRGLESNGMLLAASVGEDGRPIIATFAEDVPNGARLK